MSSSEHSHHVPPSDPHANDNPERAPFVAPRSASGFEGRSRHHRLSADRGLLPAFEHWAHALGVLPYLIILACPLMHLFMHGGHGRNASGPTGPQHRHDGA